MTFLKEGRMFSSTTTVWRMTRKEHQRGRPNILAESCTCARNLHRGTGGDLDWIIGSGAIEWDNFIGSMCYGFQM